MENLLQIVKTVFKRKMRASQSQFLSMQDTEKERKVLEMFWNPNQDQLIYDLTKILEAVKDQPATRRLILTTATRFFDPLGLISLVILPFKIMFQKLCKAQRDWNELVDTELNQEWFSTLSDLRLAGRVSLKGVMLKVSVGMKLNRSNFNLLQMRRKRRTELLFT